MFLKRRRYRLNTIKTYLSFLKEFGNFVFPKEFTDCDLEDVKRYIDYLINDKKVASSTQNQAINALKCSITLKNVFFLHVQTVEMTEHIFEKCLKHCLKIRLKILFGTLKLFKKFPKCWIFRNVQI